MSLIIPPSQSLVDSAFSIDNSCRFDKASSARLYKSMTLPTNYTISCWVKRANLSGGTIQYVYRFSAEDNLAFTTADLLQVERRSGRNIITTKSCRDTSAWYHFVVIASASNLQLFVNGVEHDYGDGGTYNRSGGGSTSGSDFQIGMHEGASGFFDGYIAEFHLLDGIAVSDATDFGEVDETYGHWKPKEYEGSYGTNGFYLDFSTSANLGDDKSGSSNDFTATNLAASDQMLDTPTNSFSTLNPNAKALYGTLSEGNLKKTGGSGHNREMSTFGFDSGKWYFEVFVETYGGANQSIGVVTTQTGNARNNLHTGSDAGGYGYYPSGINQNGSTNGGTYASYTTGDLIGVACDMDNLKVYFYKNGANAITSGDDWEDLVANTTYAFSCSMYNSGTQILNFGQDGTFAGEKTAADHSDGNGYGNFFHAVPSGFLALCTKNLPDPTVTPSEHFNTILYTGTGSSNARTGVGFQPDLVWIKNRDATYGHQPYDSVRGVQKKMHTNNTNAETTDSNGLTAFGSDGFTVGSNVGVNANTQGHVAWCWKAGGSGSSNEDGSINTTSTSANVAGGFSISTYTGTGSNATVGHGLAVAPNLVIVKSRSGGEGWLVGSVQSVASMDFTDNLRLDGTTALVDEATSWNDLPPTASVVNIGTAGQSNQSSATYVMYCWHNVEGYSKVGTYTGNGNADGSFIYTGFAPAYVIRKRTDSAASWLNYDRARNSYNLANFGLQADTTAVETTGDNQIDFLSNGFKLRATDTYGNASGGKYIYMAFAETPFKNSNAR